MNRPAAPSAFAISSNPSGPVSAFERYRPYVLSILRIVAGLLFFEHGMAKVFGFPPHGHIPVFHEIEWFAGRIELVGGGLFALGFGTRAVALVMSGEMAIGYFMDHAPHSFFPLLNGGDSPILYCFLFLYFVFAGAGPLSLDALIWRKR